MLRLIFCEIKRNLRFKFIIASVGFLTVAMLIVLSTNKNRITFEQLTDSLEETVQRIQNDSQYSKDEQTLIADIYEAYSSRDFESYNRLTLQYVNLIQPRYPAQGYLPSFFEDAGGEVINIDMILHGDWCRIENIQYRVNHQIYPYIAMSASDCILKLNQVAMPIFFIFTSIFVSYRCLQKEKKEQSYKIIWTYHLNRKKIILSKILSLFILSCFIMGLSILSVWIICGLKNGFSNAASRILYVYQGRFLNQVPLSSQKSGMKIMQRDLNAIMFLFNCLISLCTVSLFYFFSTWIKNNACISGMTLLSTIGSPYLMGILYSKGFYWISKGFPYNLFSYFPIQYLMRDSDTLGKIIYNKIYSNILPINYSIRLGEIYKINLQMGFLVGIITSLLLILGSLIIQNKKDIY